MPKFKTIIRVKDEDSATSRSWTAIVDAYDKGSARKVAKDESDSLRDVFPYAKISVSVKEMPNAEA